MSQGDRMERTPTADPTQKPVVRIGGACFVCRAKKRKCSGENYSERRLLSVCYCKQDRYVANAETPSSVANGPGNKSGRHISKEIWPPSLDSGLMNRANTCRGLPKHHIRKLEARLRRTETLLRSLLHFVSDEQLESSLRDVAPMVSMGSAQDKENADPDVWQFYPLTTLEDVRAWQSRTAGPGLSEVPPTAHTRERDAPVDDDSVPSQHGGSSRQSDHSPCPIPATAASPGERARTLQGDNYPANIHPISGATSCGGSHALSDSEAAEVARADKSSPVASTFLPADFQKEFLW